MFAALDRDPFILRCKTDINFLAAQCQFKPSWQQWDMMQAVQIATRGYPAPTRPLVSGRVDQSTLGKQWLACKSGQGPGKTRVSNIIATFRILQAEGAPTTVTAPTMRQCRDVWLAEYTRGWRDYHPLLQRMIKPTKSRVVVADRDDWGIKFVTAIKEENAQGIHHPYQTWLGDEASGLLRAMCVQVEGTLSNLKSEGGAKMNGLFVLFGNPNTRDCYFFDCFNIDRERWFTYTMNAEESPPHIVSPERNRLLAEKYGKDSDIYRIRVLGEFPRSDPACVISSEDLEACARTDPYEMSLVGPYEGHGIIRPRRQIGIDFARFGGDENTAYFRDGMSIVQWKAWQHTDPNEVLDEVVKMRKELGWEYDEPFWVFDAGGIGQGIAGRVYKAAGDGKVLEFHSGSTLVGSQDYYDKITEAYFELGHITRRRECYIPRDSRLFQQLSSRRYGTDDKHGRGCLRLESKEEYVKRLKRDRGLVDSRGELSPDRAEGCVFAFYPRPDTATTVSSR